MGYFGFYEDAAKVTTIILGNNILTSPNPERLDYIDGGDIRLANGDLLTYVNTDGSGNDIEKFEELLTCIDVTAADRNTLKTEFDLHRAFYYYPDVINRSTEYYEVKWTGGYNETPSKKTGYYILQIQLKEV